ncbi:MAG TPA: Spy/CpxP family protein refolding chaperone [Gemmatimonadaceae bacterium]|nr:Spy/CpxP family protein refolding chaperone [Gemmatimonadaceae bacterium]
MSSWSRPGARLEPVALVTNELGGPMQGIRSLVVMAGVVTGLTSATAAEAQVISGAVGGATRVGTGVGTSIGTSVDAGVRTPAADGQVDRVAGAAEAGARTGGHTAVGARQMIATRTATMLEGITLTANQRTAIDAYGKIYAARVQELGGAVEMDARADAGASTDSTVAVQSNAEVAVQAPAATAEAEARTSARREQLHAAAAEYRARVRGVLTAKQQARFDANLKAEAQAHGTAHP